MDGCRGGEAAVEWAVGGVRGVAVLGELDAGGSKNESVLPGASNSLNNGGLSVWCLQLSDCLTQRRVQPATVHFRNTNPPPPNADMAGEGMAGLGSGRADKHSRRREEEVD